MPSREKLSEFAAKIEQGETITALGVPKNYPDPKNC